MVSVYGITIKHNMIGPILMEDSDGNCLISEYILRDNEVTLGGVLDTYNKLAALKEMFRFAPDNTVIRRVIGGERMAIDLTENQRNIVFCTFTTDKLLSGFYLLRSFEYLPKPGYSGYPFRLRMFFLGTDRFYFYAFINWAHALSNDWEI